MKNIKKFTTMAPLKLSIKLQIHSSYPATILIDTSRVISYDCDQDYSSVYFGYSHKLRC